jgi:hypothetical protein
MNHLESGIVSAVSQDTVGSAGGVASLDGTGKVPQAQIPAVALTDFLGAVGSDNAMLALTGQRGDWCTRTDRGTDWQLITDDPTVLANWREHVYPASPVSSVAGRTGAVTLSSADITDATPAATASTIPIRDANGRLQVTSPAATADAATKGYVDGSGLGVRRVTVRATATQTITSSAAVPVVLTFGAATGSAAGWASGNPTRLLPMAGAGEYDLQVFIPWPGNASGTRGVAYRVNGGAWRWVTNRPANEATFGSEMSANYPGITLAATDYLEVGAWQDSGATLTLSNNASEEARASLERVS